MLWAALSQNVWAKCDPNELVVKLGTAKDSETPARTSLVSRFSETVNRELQGKACLEIVYDPQKFSGGSAVTSLQVGDVQFTVPSVRELGRVAPSYKVFDLPFAFRDVYALDRFGKVAAPYLKQGLASTGMIPLGFQFERFLIMAGSTPIFRPADVAGRKFRVNDVETFREQVSLLRATAKDVSENDLDTTLKTKKIDVQITGWRQILDDKTAKLGDGITETNHAVEGYELLTSRAWWTSLEPDIQRKFSEIANRVLRQAGFEARSREGTAKTGLISSGIPVRGLTDKQRRQWRDALAPVWRRFEDKKNEDLLNALRQANSQP